MNRLEVQSWPDATNTQIWAERKVDGFLRASFNVNSISVDLSPLEDFALQAEAYLIVTCIC